jgi:hypothetical protein
VKPERPAPVDPALPREGDAAEQAPGSAAAPQPLHSPHQRPWWHNKTVEEFRAALKGLDGESVQLVLDEIEVTVPVLQAVVVDKSVPEDRRTRASYALAYYRQKAVYCRAELRLRAKARRVAGQEQFSRYEAARNKVIAEARAAALRGQYGTAIMLALDLFEKKNLPSPSSSEPEST